jgi:glycosyltransferase involved in cell wall biosynthesis
MQKKTISVLVFDLSDNALVRTYPIVKVLSRRYNVEIIGIIFGNEIYNPYQNEFNFKIISRNKKKSKVISYFLMVRDIIGSIKGDIIYAFKPKFFSFGVGLLAKFFYKIPLVLDIEDLETANWMGKSFVSKIRLAFSRFDSENEFLGYAVEKFVPSADEIIVVSKFLQNKFGGTRIVHGVDTNLFNPNDFSKQDARCKLGLNHEDKYILFSGMPREHKGIEELVNAVLNINHEDLKILIVGGDIHHKYYKKLLSIGGGFIKAVGPRPHSEMPSFLAASDMVVLPQRKTLFAKAQVPAKVFEAMAMGKPIISTSISDLPEILDRCGIVIEPNLDTTNLENQIKILVNNPTVSQSLGLRAREKCVSQYSWDSMGPKLHAIFNRHLNK